MAIKPFVKSKIVNKRTSSTEYSSNNAWNCNTNNGNCNNNNKNNNNNVRAFRELLLIDTNVMSNMEDEYSICEYKNGIPLEEFFEAYYDCRRHKRTTINALSFEIDYAEKLVELYHEVNEYRYKIGKSICFCITRPKLREVFAADFRDRIVHHLVIRKLNDLFESVFIYDNYNCRKDKGVLFGVNRLKEQIDEAKKELGKDIYVGKFDMSGFFMSIDKDILYQMLHTFIKERYNGKDIDLVLWLVHEIVYNKPQDNCEIHGDKELFKRLPPNKSLFTNGKNKGLPIGNLTSQIFANFLLHQFDIVMREKYKYYGRYVDDFYVIGEKKDILSIREFATNYLKEKVKIILSQDKIYIQKIDKGVKFIGSVIKQDRIYTGNQTIANIYDKISWFNKNIIEQNVMAFSQTMNSYFGFLKHSKTYAIRRNMIERIDSMWFKYIYIQNFNKVVVKNKYKYIINN